MYLSVKQECFNPVHGYSHTETHSGKRRYDWKIHLICLKINVKMAIRKLSVAHFDQLLWCTLGLKVWKEAHIETYTVYVYNYQHDTSSTSDCRPMLPFIRKRWRIINFEATLSPYLTHSVSFSHALTGNPSGGFAGKRRKKKHWALKYCSWANTEKYTETGRW